MDDTLVLVNDCRGLMLEVAMRLEYKFDLYIYRAVKVHVSINGSHMSRGF